MFQMQKKLFRSFKAIKMFKMSSNKSQCLKFDRPVVQFKFSMTLEQGSQLKTMQGAELETKMSSRAEG